MHNRNRGFGRICVTEAVTETVTEAATETVTEAVTEHARKLVEQADGANQRPLTWVD